MSLFNFLIHDILVVIRLELDVFHFKVNVISEFEEYIP